MELKQFIKTALQEIVDAVDEVSADSKRDMHVIGSQQQRCIEFDIAVTVEKGSEQSGKAGIKVWELLEGGGEVKRNSKDSEVSRICFGVDVSSMTKQQIRQSEADYDNYTRGLSSGGSF